MNIKELERLENKASAARAIYHSTPLDSAGITEFYAKYKAAYMAASYARFFNLDNNK